MCGIGLELVTSQAANAPPAGRTIASAASALRRRGPDAAGSSELSGHGYRLSLIGAVLALRGTDEAVAQPLADESGNMLLWNGEIFGGCSVPVPPGASDTRRLLAALGAAASVPALMRAVRTARPPAVVLWWYSCG